MKVVLISTYELGRQPFGLASPAAWLRERGHQVCCADLAVGVFPSKAVREADLVAFYLPMHTATRLAVKAIERVREINPGARLCCYGLYASMNEPYLRSLGVSTILGGEFEPGLVALADDWKDRSFVSLDRLQFVTPDRAGLPSLGRYAKLRINGEEHLVGYTEASRGCKHLCRHCPVVPVYNGVFRVVQPDVVLEDIRRQVGSGAGHVTFGDPDFFNGPGHAIRIVEALHTKFPAVSYDVTIKIEHLLKHRDLMPRLKETGCAFVTSAVESTDDAVLARLEKGHTKRDFFEAARLLVSAGVPLNPTFIAFTPWTTRESYADMLQSLVELNLVDAVSPIQLALRLLIPAGSRLKELPDLRTEAFDQTALVYPWKHDDPEMDRLAASVMRLVKQGSRREVFREVCDLTGVRVPENFDLMPRATIPYLDEPWYC